MIAQPAAAIQPSEAIPLWRRHYAQAITALPVLLSELGLSTAGLGMGGREFPLRVPRPYVARMRHGDPSDPLLRQVLPSAAEDLPDALALQDPVGDAAARRAPGLLHKYHGRVLLVLTGACGVHCRYCFRRDYPYADQTLGPAELAPALDYIRQDARVTEVILSGGDPLSWSDQRLAALVALLADIPHVQRLRIHTRLPIVIPARVDAELLRWLGASPLKTVMVVHVNHAQELDEDVGQALQSLRDHGVLLLNQAVLLKGVNDDVEALSTLSERLFQGGVLPYYLHKLDRARGVGHFAVPDHEAQALMQALRARLPGYLLPRYVVELAGAEAKLPA